MKILRYKTKNGPAIGVIIKEKIINLNLACSITGITAPSNALSAMNDKLYLAIAENAYINHPETFLGEDLDLLPPVDRPGKFFALAANYSSHADEVGMVHRDKKTYVPRVFPKLSSTIVGPNQDIVIPSVSDMVDYEVEISLLIGKRADRVTEQQASQHIAGWMVFNDVTGRRMNFPNIKEFTQEDEPWYFLYGKWCNGFAVLGPWLVGVDELKDPSNLRMELKVNGEIRQSALVGEMTFNPTEAISFISSICVLEPGDIISMGTPSGIGEMGAGCLADGDVVEASIETIGSQCNRVTNQVNENIKN